MRFEPGYIRDLKNDLSKIDPGTKAKTSRLGSLEESKLIDLCNSTSDLVYGEHASEKDVVSYDSLGDLDLAINAIKNDEIAFVVLAGGAGTRAGGPKALMRLPKTGITLAANKLLQSCVRISNQNYQAKTWFMTSPSLVNDLARHFCGIIPEPNCSIFEQFESCRLDVGNRVIFRNGVPDLYPTGHGDLGPALIESGILDENPNIKHCVVVNCDNVLASLDLFILNQHLKTRSHVTCELIKREKNDKGGIPLWVNGRLQIVENFRLQDGLADDALYHNTNSMIISVEALRSNVDWRWYRVRKQLESKFVIQYERLIQQYTEMFDTQYVLVDRNLRYMPVKTEEDMRLADDLLNIDFTNEKKLDTSD